MNTEQLEQVQANYLSNPIAGLAPALRDAGGEGAAAPHTVEAYLTFDEAATILATSFAMNVWCDTTHIQYRVASRALPPFDQRHGQRVEDVEPTYRTFGWRPAHDIGEDTARLFAPYVRHDGEES